jgi:POT family proton-dependent oligopeptide transporter
MMGLAYLTYFFTSIFMGRLGGFYEPLGPSMFWLLHAAIGAGGGIAVLLFGGMLTKALTPPR